MIQLTTKINHRVSSLVIVLSLVFVVVIFGYYWFFSNFQTTSNNEVVLRSTTQTSAVRASRPQFFEAARNLKQYGAWPIMHVPLSADRGNPFAPK